MKNISDKLAEKIKAHILFSITLLRKSCLLWDNLERYCRGGQTTYDNIIRRMRIPCWITEATKSYSEYIIFIAFPLQQWLHERSSMLRYTYTACLVVLEL